MENKHKKLSFKQVLILIWMYASLFSVILFAEAPVRILIALVCSFILSVYVFNHTSWEGTEFDDEEE